MRKIRRWTEEEIQYLANHYLDESDSQIAKKLNRSRTSVQGKRVLMNLKKFQGFQAKEKRWSGEDVSFLKQNAFLPDRAIAEKIGKSVSSVYHKRRRLGFKKWHFERGTSTETKRKIEKLNLEEICYLAGFLDCDGTIAICRVNKKKSFRAYLAFTNTNQNAISWIAEKLGRKFQVRKPQKGSWRSWYIVYLTNLDAIKMLLERLYPYLKVKKEQASVMIEFCRYRMEQIKARIFGIDDYSEFLFNKLGQLHLK